MMIEGKLLKEWADAPCGAFAKAVRKTIDPEWGVDLLVTEGREWEVRIDYSYSGRGTAYYTVKARNEKEAEELAMREFDDDGSLDFFDAEVDDAEVGSAKRTG